MVGNKIGRQDRAGDTRFVHGASAYINWLCSCEVCRTGHRDRRNVRRRERYAYTALHGLPVEVAHGASAYVNWGCRCDVCTDGQRRQRRSERRRQREADQ